MGRSRWRDGVGSASAAVPDVRILDHRPGLRVTGSSACQRQDAARKLGPGCRRCPAGAPFARRRRRPAQRRRAVRSAGECPPTRVSPRTAVSGSDSPGDPWSPAGKLHATCTDGRCRGSRDTLGGDGGAAARANRSDGASAGMGQAPPGWHPVMADERCRGRCRDCRVGRGPATADRRTRRTGHRARQGNSGGRPPDRAQQRGRARRHLLPAGLAEGAAVPPRP